MKIIKSTSIFQVWEDLYTICYCIIIHNPSNHSLDLLLYIIEVFFPFLQIFYGEIYKSELPEVYSTESIFKALLVSASIIAQSAFTQRIIVVSSSCVQLQESVFLTRGPSETLLSCALFN